MAQQLLTHGELVAQVEPALKHVDRTPGMGRIKLVRRQLFAAKIEARNVLELAAKTRESNGTSSGAAPSQGFDVSTGFVALGQAQNQRIGHYTIGAALEASIPGSRNQERAAGLERIGNIAIRYCAAVPDEMVEDFDLSHTAADHGMVTTVDGSVMHVLAWGPYHSSNAAENLVRQPWSPNNVPSEALLVNAENRAHLISAGVSGIAQALGQ